MINVLKFMFFWPIALIQGIILFPIHVVTTIFCNNGHLIELARRRDIVSIQDLIFRGYNVNKKNSFGQTALHGVFFDTAEHSLRPNMAIPVLKILIDAGADVNIVDVRNWSPLLYAIGADYTKESLYLINTKKILLNKKFYAGRTALHYAVIKKNVTIIKYLLEKGADPYISDDQGLIPAQYCQNQIIFDLFKENRAI